MNVYLKIDSRILSKFKGDESLLHKEGVVKKLLFSVIVEYNNLLAELDDFEIVGGFE